MCELNDGVMSDAIWRKEWEHQVKSLRVRHLYTRERIIPQLQPWLSVRVHVLAS